MTINIDELKKIVENGKDNPEELTVALANIFESETKGLEKNKNDILLEKKAVEEKLKNLSTKLDNIDINEYNLLKSEKEKNKIIKGGRSSEDADILLELNKLKTDNELLNQKLTEVDTKKSELENKIKSDKIKLALTTGYTNAGVKKEFIDLLVKSNKDNAKAQVNDAGEIDILMSTENGGVIPIDQHMENWKTSENAKLFIQAPNNIGGGSNGSANVGGKAKSEMTVAEATKYVLQHGREAFNKLG